MPRVSRAVDWEAELCFVVGKTARYVKAADAGEYIAGYCIGNDVSVRDWQFHSPTWMMGKSFDTHGPIGPWLVTPDEVDVGNLDVRLWVNGELKQESNTNQLIFGVGEIVEYLERRFHAGAGRRRIYRHARWRRRRAEAAGVPEAGRHGPSGDHGARSAGEPGGGGARVSHYDVVIVGYGPVGQVAANLLGQRGYPRSCIRGRRRRRTTCRGRRTSTARSCGSSSRSAVGGGHAGVHAGEGHAFPRRGGREAVRVRRAGGARARTAGRRVTCSTSRTWRRRSRPESSDSRRSRYTRVTRCSMSSRTEHGVTIR